MEALLLSAGESLSLERMRDLLGLPSTVHVGEAVAAIAARWSEARLPVEIQEIGGGHRVVTRPEYAEYVKRLWRRPVADRLSHTLLETLSIVAYKQPVARAEIERIRGVQCGEALRALLDRRLLKVAGRSDQPGPPPPLCHHRPLPRTLRPLRPRRPAVGQGSRATVGRCA